MGLSSNAVLRSISRLIPEAYEKDSSFNSDLKSFYENSSCFLEPWDGPAALVFTNGNIIGAALDRNGLRPVRYHITKDNMIILGSEAGMVNMILLTLFDRKNCTRKNDCCRFRKKNIIE
ncbi:hypothetical protein CM15mP43_05030 [bacterium]|nr:MAG: hypothetical protein CM15mP43_05030 [bacterium]